MYTEEQMDWPTDQAGQDTVLVALNDSDTILWSLGSQLDVGHWAYFTISDAGYFPKLRNSKLYKLLGCTIKHAPIGHRMVSFWVW